ncbi:N-acetylmuramoyl-L-alanine amidase [Prevotella sp. RM4]|uniref:N-acetylmuramoyl-L-alanine amidase n=1 Tax=Prevotella sp. RM4 TaxID=1200547 RepID=UPI00051C2AB3|nr:N-acetylmuramoyl-L-alanine amidase [Prevotella sp. RM4]
MRSVNLIVIHCSATRCNRRFTVDMLKACHNARFGNKGIGYHYYIERDGHLYQTRDESLVGMHARHYNTHSIGICYEGGLNEQGQAADTRTPEQRAALIALLRSLKEDYPQAEILGHRELEGVHKECPSFDCQEYRDYFSGSNVRGTVS